MAEGCCSLRDITVGFSLLVHLGRAEAPATVCIHRLDMDCDMHLGGRQDILSTV